MVTKGQLIEWARALGYLGLDEQPNEIDLRAIFWLYSEQHQQDDHNA